MSRSSRPLVSALTYARAALATPVFVGYTPFASVGAMIAGPLGLHRAADAIIRSWTRLILRLFDIRLDVKGLENLPPEDGGCLFVFNHQSHIDVPVIHTAIRRTLRFGAKIELFRIPFFGAGMRAVGVLPITRSDPAAVIRVYKAAKSKFEQGFNFVLAPEGTRQTEPRIGPFKKGPFLFAIDAQVPIIPVVIKGTMEMLPKGRIAINVGKWSRTAQVRVLRPIPTQGMTAADAVRLRDDVRAKMIEAYERL